MKKLIHLSTYTLILAASACGPLIPQHKTVKLNLKTQGKTAVMVVGAMATETFKTEAQEKGIKVEGETILRLSGDSQDIADLNIPVENNLTYLQDTKIKFESNTPAKPDQYSLYLAKKEFGMESFLKKYPTADGRDVIVGVVDDGISPHQVGFQKTTTGQRKFLAKGTQSTLTQFTLTETESDLVATIKEGQTFSGKLDLNQDEKNTDWTAKVSKDGSQVCLDLNVNQTYEASECRGTFSKTGDYFLLPANPKLSLLAEVDLEKKILKILQTEKGEDSHGEGVASVLAGHKLGGLEGFDGVAPGAQIVDYDLSAETNKFEEAEYTIGTFLLAFDWMAQNKAEVINVSYSLFFTNAEVQTFMAKAINALVEKHNLIISFSAGNNGPGLGSLNRRLIYPPSVLVAGAYVSKELDERVHGVTGLPEEGRVVFYSSRGPGAGAGGPTLISPLSSLTHSSPDSGYRAFSGTSSASPALAGAAAVLVSAIKQAGLKVHAATVVNALRLSGKQLKHEPFIAQGYGLPQLEKAMDIYKELISGSKISDISAVINRGSIDNVNAQGIIIKKSEAQAIETFRIQLTGSTSPLAPSEAAVNLLTPVRLEYSRGITGPKELWVSSSANRLFVDVDVEAALQEKSESFGEIRVISQIDNSLMHIVPVTLINDVRANSFTRFILDVGPQEGNRFHLNVPEGVKGLVVNARVISGDAQVINISTFDPNYIRQAQFSFTNNFILPTPKAGHYQLAISMSGGTARRTQVEFEVEEIQLKLNTTSASSEGGKISLSNKSKNNVNGILSLEKVGKIHVTKIFNNKNIPDITLTLPKNAEYKAILAPTSDAELSYHYSNCKTMEKSSEGQFTPVKDETYKGSGEGEVTLKFRCTPFDLGVEATEKFEWIMSVVSVQKAESLRIDISGKKRKDLSLPKLEASLYQVFFINSLNPAEKVYLGDLQVM